MHFRPKTYDPVSLAIIDNFPLYRTAIAGLMSMYDEIDLVGEYSSGTDFLVKMQTTRKYPEVVLINLHMPGMNGVELARKFQENNLNTNVVVLANYDDPVFAENAYHFGVKAYLLKHSDSDHIFNAIQAAREGKIYYNNVFTPERIHKYEGIDYSKNQGNLFPHFTDQEANIIELLCEDLTNEQIALQLGINDEVVEDAKHQIMQKMGVRTSVGIAVFAFQHGLVN